MGEEYSSFALQEIRKDYPGGIIWDTGAICQSLEGGDWVNSEFHKEQLIGYKKEEECISMTLDLLESGYQSFITKGVKGEMFRSNKVWHLSSKKKNKRKKQIVKNQKLKRRLCREIERGSGCSVIELDKDEMGFYNYLEEHYADLRHIKRRGNEYVLTDEDMEILFTGIVKQCVLEKPLTIISNDFGILEAWRLFMYRDGTINENDFSAFFRKYSDCFVKYPLCISKNNQ